MNQTEKTVDALIQDHVDFEQDLFEQGMNSNAILQLVIRVREKFGIDIDVEQFLLQPTMRHLNQLIQAQSPEKSETLHQDHKPEARSSGTQEHCSLLDMLKMRLERKDIDPETDIFEQGLTSFELMDLVIFVKEKYKLDIDITAFFEQPTLVHFVQLVQSASGTDPAQNVDDVSAHNQFPAAEIGILSSVEDKEAFKAQQRNIRKGLHATSGTVIAPTDIHTFLAKYEFRKTFRTFDEGQLEAKNVIRWLSELNAHLLDGRYRYQYPSAGGTYSVQTYIEVKPGKVKGLEPGNYYFNPIQHSLQKVSTVQIDRTSHFYYNRPYYDAAQVCLYFVIEYEGIRPIYKERSDFFAAVEIGAIVQLLSQCQAEFGLGTCPLSGIDETSIARALALQDSQQVVFGLLAGLVHFADETAGTLPDEYASTALVKPKPLSNTVVSLKSVQSTLQTQTGAEPHQEQRQSLVSKQALTRGSLSPVALNEGQKGLWVVQQRHSQTSAYNCPIAYRLKGEIDVSAFQLALRDMVHCFPILSCRVSVTQGVPALVNSENGQIQLRLEDATEHAGSGLVRFCAELVRKPFELSAGSLFRAYLVRGRNHEQIVLLCAHHIVSDGASIQPMIQTLFACYKKYVEKEENLLPPPKLGWIDFQQKEQQRLDSEHGKNLISYWKQNLAEAPESSVPLCDLPRQDSVPLVGEALDLVLDQKLVQAIRAMSKKNHLYVSSIMLSLFKLLVYRFSGQNDLVIGMPSDARSEMSLLGEVGYFVYPLPIRSQINDADSYLKLARNVQKSMLEGLAHAVPFPCIARALGSSHSMDSYPVFQVGYVYQKSDTVSVWPDLSALLPEGLSAQPLKELGQRGEYELMFEVVDTPDEFVLNLKYNPTLYQRKTVQRWLALLRQLLVQVAEQPEVLVQDIQFADEFESSCVLQEWNETALDLGSPVCIHTLFEKQVQKTPGALAVVFENQHLSYQALHVKTDQLAYCLQQLGVNKGDLVGVCMSRSVEMVVALLGVLKAGAAYVPLDPAYPAQRLAYITDDTRMNVVLTQHLHTSLFSQFSGRLICLDASSDTVKQHQVSPKLSGAGPQDRCYVLYTSGSTGQPKGCVLSHSAVVNRLRWMQEKYKLGTNDRVLQKTPFSFDVSVWEFFWPLMAGACIVVAAPDGHKDPEYLVDIIKKHEVTVCHFVPSMLSLFLESSSAVQCNSLIKVFTSGEALPYSLVQNVKRKLQLNLHNLYGPTEAAIDVTYWDSELRKDKKIPIGKPIANTQLYIVDQHCNPLPVGAPGELLIGGAGLADGYLNKPELTAEKFIQNPFCQGGTHKLYRTGDLARWLDDGNIEFLGRIDSQVKIRGLRIELGEIEAAILSQPSIREAVVVVVGENSSEKYIVAYVVPVESNQLAIPQLKLYLASALPEYMLPAMFVEIATIPLSSNGKLDKKQLPDARLAAQKSVVPIAAVSALEKKLAALWCDVLKLDQVGINENFFELGGNSLTALTLLAKIQDDIPELSLSQVAFYQAPTIQGSVATPNAETTASEQNGVLSVLVLATQEPALTLVCVPYAGANATIYQPLASGLSRLASDISVLGLTNPGNDFGFTADSPASSYESIAQQCVQEIVDKFQGQIAVYGHCVGSYLALEITRRLESLGRRPLFLIAAGAFPLPGIVRYLPLEDRWKYKTDDDLWYLLQQWGMPQNTISASNMKLVLNRFRSDARMALRYEKERRKWKIQTPLFSMVSQEDPLTTDAGSKFKAWKRCAEHVELVSLDQGNHYFVGEQARQVASLIVQIRHQSEADWPAGLSAQQAGILSLKEK